MQELLLAVARGLVEDKDAVKGHGGRPREDGTIVYHPERGRGRYGPCHRQAGPDRKKPFVW